MSSPGQRKGSCGHIMASFDKHARCARCRDKGHGEDPCVKNLACKFCDLVTPEQLLQLSTPTYKIRKEKQKSKEVLVDPSTVTVTSMDSMHMSSPLENLYSKTDLEPVFYQPSPVASTVSSSPLQFPARDIVSPDQFEEGEVSEPDDQQDSDSGDKDKVLSEDQNYRETVHGVRAFMG